MPSIGETLREARMRRRLDIADVEEKTKIRAKYLRALENEEFGLLPGATFAKTFLRTYAELLGLDPHRLVEEYKVHHEPRDELEPQGLGPSPAPGRERRLGGPPGPGVIVGVAVVAIIALLLVLGLTGEEEGGEPSSRSADDGQAERRETRERPRRRRRPGPVPASVTLRLTPAVPTYVCLDRGRGTPVLFEGIVQQSRTFRGRRLRLTLGKSSTRLVVNGRPVALEQTPNPVGIDFRPRGRAEIPPQERPCA